MKKQIAALAVAAACIASVQAQTTITNYTTGFFVDPPWDPVGDPQWIGQQGWTGAGDADSVSNIAGYSRDGGNSGTLGVFAPSGNVNNVNRAFTPMDTGTFQNISTTFITEWSLIDFALGGPDDTFVFDLRDGGTSLLSFTMQAPGGVFDYTLSSVDAGGTTAQWQLNYDTVYRMQIDLADDGSWTGELFGVTDPSDPVPIIASLGFFTPGTLAAGGVSTDFNNIQIDWILADDFNNPGPLGMVVNEVTIISSGELIPEPGTWAVGALLVGGVAASIYRRRKAADKTAA